MYQHALKLMHCQYYHKKEIKDEEEAEEEEEEEEEERERETSIQTERERERERYLKKFILSKKKVEFSKT